MKKPFASKAEVEIDLILKGIKTGRHRYVEKFPRLGVEIDLILKGIKTLKIPISYPLARDA